MTVTYVSEHLLPMCPVYTNLIAVGERSDTHGIETVTIT